MGKAVGGVVVVFMLGAAVMTLLQPALGAYAEAAALACLGAGLMVTSQTLGSKPASRAKPVSPPTGTLGGPRPA